MRKLTHPTIKADNFGHGLRRIINDRASGERGSSENLTGPGQSGLPPSGDGTGASLVGAQFGLDGAAIPGTAVFSKRPGSRPGVGALGGAVPRATPGSLQFTGLKSLINSRQNAIFRLRPWPEARRALSRSLATKPSLRARK